MMSERGSGDTLRVMTYNIRACRGLDNARSPERTAQVIEEQNPDIVALQEVDLERSRSGMVNQASLLASLTGLHWIAAPSFNDGTGDYGNALLSRMPAELLEHRALPNAEGHEPRSVMRVRIVAGATPIHLINTHLGFRRRDRALQMEELLSERWLADDQDDTPKILCGDLNCSPRDPWFRRLSERMTDAPAAAHRRPSTTWPTRRPFRRIDHLLVSGGIEVIETAVVRTEPSRLASDHYPLVADLRVPTRPSTG